MTSSHHASRPDPALPEGWIRPAFHGVEGRVAAVMSARAGGVSGGPYESCNLGDHVRDDPAAVSRNRQAFAKLLGATPAWLTQVHGHRVVRLSRDVSEPKRSDIALVNPEYTGMAQPEADGAFTTEPGLACTVMVADCLPVLLMAPEGRGVAALHAGWRGLAGAGDMGGRGIVHTGVQALCEATGVAPGALRAWLGPCIGPTRFEVGADVLRGFGVDPVASTPHPRFKPMPAQNPAQAQAKWLADLQGLAADVLVTLGVRDITGGAWCTVGDASRFFSFRRDGVTGRQAAAICIR